MSDDLAHTAGLAQVGQVSNQQLWNVARAARLIEEAAAERERLGAYPQPCGATFAHPEHERRLDLGGDLIRWYRCPGFPPSDPTEEPAT